MICQKVPVDSQVLVNLTYVSWQHCQIVRGIYERNINDILKYANKITFRDTFFGCILSNASAQYKEMRTSETIANLTQDIRNRINRLRFLPQKNHEEAVETCYPIDRLFKKDNGPLICTYTIIPLRHIPFKNISSLSSKINAIQDTDLQTIWSEISKSISTTNKPNLDASAQAIRNWINENRNVVEPISVLDLSNLGLRSIPKELTLLTNLQVLRLDKNDILALPENIFDTFLGLQTLCLNENSIYDFPTKLFEKLSNLRTLHINGNRVLDNHFHYIKKREIPEGAFDQLINLDSLEICENNINYLSPNLFRNLTKLTALYIENNNINYLPEGIFDSLTSLKELSLRCINSSNLYNRVPCEGVKECITINLSKNRFQKLTALKELNLSGNTITDLSLETFQGIRGLKVLSIVGVECKGLPYDLFKI